MNSQERRFHVVLTILASFIMATWLWAKHPVVYPPAPATQTTPAGVSHAGPKYILGVFAQPIYNFDDVKVLGFNTLVSVPQNHDPLAWAQAATQKGMYQIRPPVGRPSLDEQNEFWIAWENPDEPDLHATTQAVIDANYTKSKALGVPVFTNFDGSRILGIQAPAFGQGASYQSLLAKTDLAAQDVYPASGWNHNLQLQSVGHAQDTLRVLGGDTGKQYLMYVECCQQTTYPAPTVDEMRAIFRMAERRNLRGVIAFSINFNLQWGGSPGKPNAFFGLDDEHREAFAEFNDAHKN